MSDAENATVNSMATAIFSTIDADDNGNIAFDELQLHLADLGFADAQIEQLFLELDTDMNLEVCVPA